LGEHLRERRGELGLMDKYNKRKAPSSPLARSRGRVQINRQALYEKLGAGPHQCHWCKCLVDWGVGLHDRGRCIRILVADHLDENTKNNTPDNLVPSCSRCNTVRSRGLNPAREGPTILYKDGGRRSADERVCLQCGDPFVVLSGFVRQGGGIFCSRSCAITHRHAENRRKKAELQEVAA
jgi:hypothetical protein